MTAAQALAAADPALARVVAGTPLPVLEPTGSVFHDLMSCVVEQQIHYRSTKGTFGRALAAAGLTRVAPDTFEAFAERGLTTLRLSAHKVDTAVRVADWFERHPGMDWHALDDSEVRARLGEIGGVGPWTVDMILIYSLGRADVLPAGDYHLKQVVSSLYGVDLSRRATSRLKALAEPWRPHRSLAVRYLLAWKEHRQMLAR